MLFITYNKMYNNKENCFQQIIFAENLENEEWRMNQKFSKSSAYSNICDRAGIYLVKSFPSGKLQRKKMSAHTHTEWKEIPFSQYLMWSWPESTKYVNEKFTPFFSIHS